MSPYPILLVELCKRPTSDSTVKSPAVGIIHFRCPYLQVGMISSPSPHMKFSTPTVSAM